jgi:hypothetical protein
VRTRAWRLSSRGGLGPWFVCLSVSSCCISFPRHEKIYLSWANTPLADSSFQHAKIVSSTLAAFNMAIDDVPFLPTHVVVVGGWVHVLS